MSDRKNRLIEDLVELSGEEMAQVQGGAICHGVSVLAWARVDGADESIVIPADKTIRFKAPKPID
jgi:hypothetical protein